MVWLDARLPLRFGSADTLAAGEMLLTDTDVAGPAGPPHVPGCACCLPRTAAAEALAALFRRRVLATGPMARAVLAAVGPDTEAAIRDALAADAVASSRFRLA